MKTKTIILLLLFSFLGMKEGEAASYTTATDGDWLNNMTWTGGVSPGVTINSSGTITISTGNLIALSANLQFDATNTLVIDGNLVINGNLIVNNNFNISITGSFTLNGDLQSNNNANVDISGFVDINGSISLNNNSSITLNTGSVLDVEGVITGDNNNLLQGTGDLYALDMTGINIDNFTGNLTLPVELLSFSAEVDKNCIAVNWVTASEQNNSYFILERSLDGFNFDIVSLVEGAGNSSTTIYYRYVDESCLNSRYFYYKLIQVDFDNRSKQLGLIVVNPQYNLYNTDFEVYTKGQEVIVEILSGDNEEAYIFIYNISGEELMHKNVSINEGVNSFSFHLPGNKAGFCILTLDIKGRKVSRKFHYVSL